MMMMKMMMTTAVERFCGV